MVSACEAIPSQVVWVGVWSTHWLRNLAANWNADLATEVRRSRCRFRSLPSDRCPTLIPSPAPLPSFHSYGQVDLPSNPAGHCASPTNIARARRTLRENVRHAEWLTAPMGQDQRRKVYD